MEMYEELKLGIARKLCKLDGWNWLELYKTRPPLDGEQIRADYYRKADEILSIIADYCWLKGEPNAPKVGDLGTEYRQAQDDLYNAGWRPVKPLKKEE